MAALDEFVAKRYGGPFNVASSVVTFGTSAVKAVAGNFERVSLLLVSLGTSPVYVLPDPTVSTTKGIVLSANGASIAVDAVDDAVLPGFDWWAVSAAAGQSVLVVEVFRYAIAAANKP